MRKNVAIRNIIVDIDGTLVDQSKSIQSFTKSEIDRIQLEEGVKLTLASSRMPSSMKRISNRLNTIEPLISYNGALVVEADYQGSISSGVLGSKTLRVQSVVAFLNLLPEEVHDLHIGLFLYDNWYVNDINYWTMREIRSTGIWPQVPKNFEKLKEEIVHSDLGVHKLLVRTDAAVVKALLEEIDSKDIVDKVFSSSPTHLELTPYDASKAKAADMVVKLQGSSMKEVMAIGDGLNDVDLIGEAGIGVAMSNGCIEIIRIADDVTLSNQEDGVGYIIRKYFPSVDVLP